MLYKKMSKICLLFARKTLMIPHFLLWKNLMWETLSVHLEKNSYYFWKVLTAAGVV